jgi:hypothetical protein
VGAQTAAAATAQQGFNSVYQVAKQQMRALDHRTMSAFL